MIRINSINSEYPEDSPYFDKSNKKVIGKFKDEASRILINEFIGLRSKMYSYLKDTDECGKTAKGIKKNFIKKILNIRITKMFYFNYKQVYHKMQTIRSQRHELDSYEINKISLKCFDDKRYLYDNGIDSYAYGHYGICSSLFSGFLKF